MKVEIPCPGSVTLFCLYIASFTLHLIWAWEAVLESDATAAINIVFFISF